MTIIAKAEEQGTLTVGDMAMLAPLFKYQVACREPEVAREPVRFTPYYEVISDDG